MLVFITSVRHPHNSSDYTRVESLLRSTLASVCAQTVQDFRVVVVCNRRPAGSFPPQVEFVVVDFPPPSVEAGPMTGREAVLLDKGTKLAVALVAAQRHHPDYVMKFDADDFVSRRLVGFLATQEGPGWFVQVPPSPRPPPAGLLAGRVAAHVGERPGPRSAGLASPQR